MGALTLTTTNSGYTRDVPKAALAASRNFLLCSITSAPSTRGFPPKAQFPRNQGRTDVLPLDALFHPPARLSRRLRLHDREHVAQTWRGFARRRRMPARCELGLAINVIIPPGLLLWPFFFPE